MVDERTYLEHLFDERLLSLRETALLMRRRPARVRELNDSGLLLCIKRGNRRYFRVADIAHQLKREVNYPCVTKRFARKKKKDEAIEFGPYTPDWLKKLV